MAMIGYDTLREKPSIDEKLIQFVGSKVGDFNIHSGEKHFLELLADNNEKQLFLSYEGVTASSGPVCFIAGNNKDVSYIPGTSFYRPVSASAERSLVSHLLNGQIPNLVRADKYHSDLVYAIHATTAKDKEIASLDIAQGNNTQPDYVKLGFGDGSFCIAAYAPNTLIGMSVGHDSYNINNIISASIIKGGAILNSRTVK